MSQVLIYGDSKINYDVVRDTARTKRIRINVFPDGSVNVDAPPEASDAAIRKAVSKRGRWITKNVRDSHDRFAHVLPREYVSGEMILYQGNRYILKVIQSNQKHSTVKLLRGLLEVRIRDTSPEAVKARVKAWYRYRAQAYFKTRLTVLATDLPFVSDRPDFHLKAMTKRWGSCSTTGTLVLNPLLVKAPRECIDYVLTHELCHLTQHNHSPEFYSLLDRHSPGWPVVKKQLDGMVEVLLNE